MTSKNQKIENEQAYESSMPDDLCPPSFGRRDMGIDESDLLYRSIAVGSHHNAELPTEFSTTELPVGLSKPMMGERENLICSGFLRECSPDIRSPFSSESLRSGDGEIPLAEYRPFIASTQFTLVGVLIGSVTAAINNFMAQNQIFSDMNAPQGCWNCKCTYELLTVVFNIQLYRTLQGKEVVVEAIRYSGDSKLFYAIFRSLQKSLTSNSLVMFSHELSPNQIPCFDKEIVPPLSQPEKLRCMKELLVWLECDPKEAFAAIIEIALEQTDTRDKILLMRKTCEGLKKVNANEELLVVVSFLMQLIMSSTIQAEHRITSTEVGELKLLLTTLYPFVEEIATTEPKHATGSPVTDAFQSSFMSKQIYCIQGQIENCMA